MQKQKENPGQGVVNFESFLESKAFRLVLSIIFVLFLVLTGFAVFNCGIIGIFVFQLQNSGSIQVLVDLVIALCLFLAWMWHDTEKHGWSFWPWLVITLAAGSFGPLLYLLFRRPGGSKNQDNAIQESGEIL